MASMPLQCLICPDSKKFSDVSHLLTHIGSKGHLSNYYRKKVRSAAHDDDRADVAAYDQWYNNWDVDKLMAERMSLKDKKKSARDKAATAHNNLRQASKKARQSHRRASGNSSSSYRPSPAPSHYDPRLDGSASIKHEPRDQQMPIGQMDFSRHPGQNSHNYPLRPSGLGRGPQYPMMGSPYDDSAYGRGYNGNGLYQNTGHHNGYMDSVNSNSPFNPAHQMSRSPKYEDSDDDLPEGDSSIEISTPGDPKLKGIIYDGMSLFDSATPSARRRRNQKKDAATLQRLEDNSLEVEPTECVWTPRGSLKKAKEISGFPTSSSPLRSPAEPAWRPSLAPEPRLNFNIADRFSGYANEDEDEHMENTTATRKKKRPFDVYHNVDDDTSLQSITQPSVAHLNTGLQSRSDHHNDADARRRRSYASTNENQAIGSYGNQHMRIKTEEVEQGMGYYQQRANQGPAAAHNRLRTALEFPVQTPTVRSPLADPFSVSHNGQHVAHPYDNNNSMFGNGSGMAQRSGMHGMNNRRSVSAMPIQDLINGTTPHPQAMPTNPQQHHNMAHGQGYYGQHHMGNMGMGAMHNMPAIAPPNQQWANFGANYWGTDFNGNNSPQFWNYNQAMVNHHGAQTANGNHVNGHRAAAEQGPVHVAPAMTSTVTTNGQDIHETSSNPSLGDLPTTSKYHSEAKAVADGNTGSKRENGHVATGSGSGSAIGGKEHAHSMSIGHIEDDSRTITAPPSSPFPHI
ncbi:hypothetical protein BT63DRAFT_267650 [Microthyrium microscopicum]|uniref:Uncharacterized protein n=1 Tax=Microthyrium microscopicum TaxID=703497 RepID=A0A6A6UCX4_9PEZI|nr:hypothetical protein BT63DRAFT_267650 [Microthyrium microscopicum]